MLKVLPNVGLEGNPFIIRFKTQERHIVSLLHCLSLEGNPFIIRFKTNRHSSKHIAFIAFRR